MNMEINPSEYKVLIVDDVISNVLLLKVLLTNEKFKIVTAGNGTQALEQVKKENPDLVLLDVMMPDISGFEVAQQMKADPEMAEIPIIFLTALNSTADIVKGFQVGGNDFISKPFNKEELIIRVTHQISLVAAKRIIVAQTEELRKTIMGRDKLYSVIAHDLRSPMGSIKMVLNMLILNLPSDTIGDEMYELLTMANQTTEDVFSLLDNLLKWTKSQIGKLKVVYQDINMVEVVEGVSEIFTMVASLKNIIDTFQRPVTKYFLLCGQLEYDSQKNVDKPQSSRYNIHHTQLSDKRQGIRSVGESDRQKYIYHHRRQDVAEIIHDPIVKQQIVPGHLCLLGYLTHQPHNPFPANPICQKSQYGYQYKNNQAIQISHITEIET